MKRGLLLFAALAMTFATTGCHRNLCQNGCNSCQHCQGGHALGANGSDYVPRVPHGYHRDLYQSQGAPPSASVAYPYYTTRAPRDFLQDNPPSIGY